MAQKKKNDDDADEESEEESGEEDLSHNRLNRAKIDGCRGLVGKLVFDFVEFGRLVRVPYLIGIAFMRSRSLPRRPETCTGCCSSHSTEPRKTVLKGHGHDICQGFRNTPSPLQLIAK